MYATSRSHRGRLGGPSDGRPSVRHGRSCGRRGPSLSLLSFWSDGGCGRGGSSFWLILASASNRSRGFGSRLLLRLGLRLGLRLRPSLRPSLGPSPELSLSLSLGLRLLYPVVVDRAVAVVQHGEDAEQEDEEQRVVDLQACGPAGGQQGGDSD